jgi:hypothetical protein
MINIAAYARRVRRRRMLAFVAFFGSAGMIALDFSSRLSAVAKLEAAIPWIVGMGIGLAFYYYSLELPKKEILQLAESHNGLLTVSEIATALAIDPDLVLHTLRHMQKIGVANPRWAELHKNLWEFPDYVKLPIAETIDLARAKGGRISMADLMAHGHTADVARQTFETLSDKGLAQRDEADTRSLIVEAG